MVTTSSELPPSTAHAHSSGASGQAAFETPHRGEVNRAVPDAPQRPRAHADADLGHNVRRRLEFDNQ